MPSAESDSLPTAPVSPAVARWVKTECGLAKYQELARRNGPWAWLRRRWFVVIAALRDWRLPPSTLP
jgi:hypothetical protein